MSISSKDKDWKETILHTWGSANVGVRSCTEDECLELLKYEKGTKRRVIVLLRIYGRYNTLRCQRERKELLRIAGQ